MSKLRKILLHRLPFYLIFILCLIYLLIYLNIEQTSSFQEGETTISGEILSLEFSGNKLSMRIKTLVKEKIDANYYFQSEEELIATKKSLSLGDTVTIKGELKIPKTTQNFYSFSYKEYLKYQDVFYIMTVSSFDKTKENTNFILEIKSLLRNLISTDKVGNYINIFFLGNNVSFSSDLLDKFRKLGISHLFALSGTQVSFISIVATKIINLFKRSDITKFIIVFLIILIYYLIIDSCAAIDRAVVFSFIFSLNKAFNFNIKPFHLILLSLSVLLFLNPYYIFDIGFQYSTIISCTLILYLNKENSKGIAGLLRISWVSFLVSLPISLYHFSEINVLSIIYNLFYVPFINTIIFPLTIICFFCSFLSPILLFFINIFEASVNILAMLDLGNLILPRIPFIFYLLYYLAIFLILYYKKKIFLIIFFLIFFAHYLIPILDNSARLYMLDVGQGDSFLLLTKGKSILIDTGGVMTYAKEAWEKGEEINNGKYLITFFKQLGLKKIDYLILTHGDYDHMGESINIVNGFKVDKVILNNGTYNNLEQELISVLRKKNIPYYQNLKELKIGDNKLYFLNNQISTDENDNSIVIYTEINGLKLLFMGDAGVDVEEEILKKYNLNNIDILKVGHHGSRTSSSEDFINSITPACSLISVGKDNKYSHPNDEVIKRLSASKIYRTDLDGAVMLKLEKDKILIKTY